jgi:alanine racemase
MSSATHEHGSWREVSEAALRHNVKTLKRTADGKLLGVVVKADAYGHGIGSVAPIAVDAGADWLVTNFAHEAKAVRALGGACATVPLYVCGTVFAHEADVIVAAGARAVLHNLDVALALDASSRARGVVTPVHVKIETGTHRQGLRLHDALALAREVNVLKGIVLEGLATHFADIEDTTDHRFADAQWQGLMDARAAFRAVHSGPLIMHAANSAATLLEHKTHGDLVRAGIATYGLWPSKETLMAFRARTPSAAREPELVPVLAWRALVAELKDVPSGAYVGYGRTWRATRPSKIAVVPVGYFEGYDRRLSNVAHMLVRGARAPVRGRVCMNMSMIDVTDIPGAMAGDVVTLLGSDGDERVSAEQLAAWMGTIHYEATSRIHGGQISTLVP